MTLRNAAIAFLLILAVIALSKANGVEPSALSQNASAATVRCSVMPQRVTEEGGRMVAAAQFRCDSPGPDGLTVTVRLQRDEGGRWTTVSEATFVSNAVYTTRERPAADRTRRASAPCASGTYRTWVEASVYDNGRSRALSGFSGERRDPCG